MKDLHKSNRVPRMACSGALALATLFASAGVMAENGFYVGGGLGTGNIEDNSGSPGAGGDFGENDTAWKGFVGYNFDLIPIVKFAAEIGYRDFGGPDGSIGGVPVEYSLKGFDYALLAGVGLGPVDLFARAGGMQYEVNKTVGGVSNDYDGTAPIYGLGLWFTIAKVGIRVDYDFVDIDELKRAEMATVNVFFKF
jgi:outer membrane immunogenic protein